MQLTFGASLMDKSLFSSWKRMDLSRNCSMRCQSWSLKSLSTTILWPSSALSRPEGTGEPSCPPKGAFTRALMKRLAAIDWSSTSQLVTDETCLVVALSQNDSKVTFLYYGSLTSNNNLKPRAGKRRKWHLSLATFSSRKRARKLT